MSHVKLPSLAVFMAMVRSKKPLRNSSILTEGGRSGVKFHLISRDVPMIQNSGPLGAIMVIESSSPSVAVTSRVGMPDALIWIVAVPARSSLSSNATSKTCWKLSQLVASKVSVDDAASTIMSGSVALDIENTVAVTVVVPSGCAFNLTPKVALLPSGTVTKSVSVRKFNTSLSSSVAVTSLFGMLAALLTRIMAVPFIRSRSSSAAARVTGWGVFQLVESKVSVPPDWTVMSVSPDTFETVAVTVAAGSLSSVTLKLAVPPSGTVTEVGLVTKLRVSLSTSVAEMSLGAMPAALRRIVAVPFITSRSSSSAWMVTVLKVAQFPPGGGPPVKVRVVVLTEMSVSPETRAIDTVTFVTGSAFSLTWRVESLPPSGTVTASLLVTMLRVSLSCSVAITSAFSNPIALSRIVAVPFPASGSSFALTVTC